MILVSCLGLAVTASAMRRLTHWRFARLPIIRIAVKMRHGYHQDLLFGQTWLIHDAIGKFGDKATPGVFADRWISLGEQGDA